MAAILEPKLGNAPAREGSDHSFGFVLATVFAIIGCLPLLRSGSPHWWALGIAGACALLAIARPRLLHYPNRIWLAFGRLLHRVTGPFVMGLVFFLCVTPIAWLMRRLGKDVLSLARRPDLASYWITRENSPEQSEAMKRQF